MRVLDLFAGIGGFSLAAHWMGWETAAFVEKEPFPQKILRKNFPGVPIYDDIYDYEGTEHPADIITGGFPCQPFSHAGKRKGTDDDRYLWPEMLRVINTARPCWVIGENVAGLKSMENGETLEGILIDLENIGYQTETFLVPAASVGAWHRRDRIWICAYAIDSTDRTIGEQGREKKTIQGNSRETGRTRVFSGTGSEVSTIASNTESERHGGRSGERCTTGERELLQGKQEGGTVGSEAERCSRDAQPSSNTDRKGLQRGKETGNTSGSREERNQFTERYGELFGGGYWSVEPNVGRVANGVPKRVDRLKGLGNAIVPQVAYEIFKAIEEYEQ